MSSFAPSPSLSSTTVPGLRPTPSSSAPSISTNPFGPVPLRRNPLDALAQALVAESQFPRDSGGAVYPGQFCGRLPQLLRHRRSLHTHPPPVLDASANHLHARRHTRAASFSHGPSSFRPTSVAAALPGVRHGCRKDTIAQTALGQSAWRVRVRPPRQRRTGRGDVVTHGRAEGTWSLTFRNDPEKWLGWHGASAVRPFPVASHLLPGLAGQLRTRSILRMLSIP